MKKNVFLSQAFRGFLNLRTILLFLLLLSFYGRGQIIAWEMDGLSGNEVTINATTNNTNLNVSSLVRGSGLNVSALPNAFSSTNYTNTGNEADALTNNKYLEFTISPKSGYAVSLTTLDVNFRRSSSGPNSFRWKYRVNSGVFVDINSTAISFTSTATNGLAQSQISLSAISALQNIPSGNVITIRLYGWGATNTGGTFAIGRLSGNDLSIDGTVTTVSTCSPPTVSNTVSAIQNPSGDVDFGGNITAVGGGTSITSRGFQLATNNTMTSPTVLSEVSSSTGPYSLNANTLSANTKYYYRAYGVNNCSPEQTGYSSSTPVSTYLVTRQFSTTANTATNISSKSFRANWTNPGAGGGENYTYKLVVEKETAPGSGIFTVYNTYPGISSATPFYNLTGLEPNTKYRYYFYSTNEAGDSFVPSNTVEVTTLSAATKLVYTVSPPVSGNVNVNLASFTVQAQRTDNSVDTDFSGNVMLTRNIVSGAGNIAGTTSVALTNGNAVFSAVQFNAQGTYTITASLSGLAAATSGNVVISPLSAATDYFQTTKSGNWNDTSASTTPWESSSDGVNWHLATLVPGNNAASVKVLTGHHIVLNTSGIVITKTEVYGTVEVVNNNFSVNGTLNGIELTIKNGGEFIVNGSGYASSGNAYALVETGGKLVSQSGSGGNFAQYYVEANSGLFYFGNNSVCEWQNSGTLASSGYTNYFLGQTAGDIPIFRLVNVSSTAFGSGTNNIFNAKLEVNSNITWAMQGAGNKTFLGGLQGTGTLTLTYSSGTGRVIFGDVSTVPTLGSTGKLTLVFPNNKIDFPNGAIIPTTAEVVLQSSAQNNYISRTGGTITVNGILDLTNIRIANSASGSITVGNSGRLKTSHPAGLKAAGTGNIQDGTLILNPKTIDTAGSTVEFYATDNQTISSEPNYFNLILSGAGVKTPSNAISVDTDGLVTITGNTIVDFSSRNLGSTSSNNTAFTMDGGRLILGTGGTQPNMRGDYNLTGGIVEFKGNGQTVRSNTYQNIEITGTDVGNSNGTVLLHNNGNFTVKSGGIFSINANSIRAENDVSNNVKVIVENNALFKTGNNKGFNGFTATFSENSSIHGNISDITLATGSTVEYTRNASQLISPVSAGYYNLKISGSGDKIIESNIIVNNITEVVSGRLIVSATPDNSASHVLYAHKGISSLSNSVIFENNAQLLQDSDAINSQGNIQSQRQVSGMNNIATQVDYVYWSSPVSGQVIKGTTGFSPNTPSSGYLQYNESTDKFTTTSDATFQTGKGYAIRAENVLPNGYSKTYSFTGVPNNGNLQFLTLQKSSGADKGYNLVGNPYPSNMNFDYLYASNTSKIYNTAWFWTNLTYTSTQMGSGYTGNNYAVYNGTGGVPPAYDWADYNPDEPSGLTPNGHIKVGQGFIVKAKTVGALDFNNGMRITDNGTFYQKNTVKNRFWLTMRSPKNMVNTILIGYIDGATNDYETDFDGELFVVGSDSFFSVSGAKKLAIQGRNSNFTTDDVVSLGNVFAENGTFTIGLQSSEGIFGTSQDVYLRDKLLNKYVNLSTDKSYTFTANKGTDTTRFEVVYKDGTVLDAGLDAKSDFIVYKDGNYQVIKSNKKLGKIELYDASGKLLKEHTSRDLEARIDVSTIINGVYILKVDNSGDIKTRKIIK